jgi:hypothetical protein
MDIRKGLKHWRLNVVVLYDDNKLATLYREMILRMLEDLASVYALDFAISLGHQEHVLIDYDPQSKRTAVADLVYFRSNKGSRVDRKKLRSEVVCMLGKSTFSTWEGIEVFPQTYKALSGFPFPMN